MHPPEGGSERVGVGVGKGPSGFHALKWLLDKETTLVTGGGGGGEAQGAMVVVLVHIYPTVRWIPTPMGSKVPASQVNDSIVEKFRADNLKEAERVMVPYTSLCQKKQVKAEVCLVAGDLIQKELVDQIFKLGLTKLVLGTSSSNPFSRAFKGESIPKFVARNAPDFCTVMVICKGKLCSVKDATESITSESSRSSNTSSIHDESRSEDGSISQYGNIRPRSSSGFMSYSPSERDPEGMMARQYSVQSDIYELHSEPETPIHWLQNSVSMDMSKFEARGLEQRNPVVIPSSEHEREQPLMSMPETLGIHPESDPVYYPEINVVYLPRSTGDIETDTRGLPSHESTQNPSVEDVHIEDVRLPESTDLLHSQLVEARHRVEIEAAQRAKSLTDAEKIIENAKQMIMEAKKRRDEALKVAELAKRQSMDDARRHEAAVAELKKIALKEQEALRQNMEEETRGAVYELTSRVDEYKKKLAEEHVRCEEALRNLEDARRELERESQLRKEAEERALMESVAKNNAITALGKLQRNLRMLQKKYTIYTFEDLEKATNNFDANNKLGEGGHGPVFKGMLHHTTVAIKVLPKDEVDKCEEFQREVEFLSHIHHPHMVMLLGACHEKGCIVFEYMANGSLADRLICKGGSPPLPWYMRFRICFEVATALLFLHSHPEPIIHHDLKPGNILLDHNYVSKISDVGIAKLVPNNLTFGITMYKETTLMGTMAYMDPDYQRTGVISCESDVYSLGIVMLQILTGQPPVGVIDLVEEAIDNHKLEDVIDKSAGDWPLDKAMELASLALDCAEPRRKHRAKLESKVLPILEKLRAYADEEVTAMKLYHDTEPVIPSFFFCPISQEIMQDPYIAADGYTYERPIIEQWLRGHDTSPMTNLKLDHKNVIPNYSVRSAIQEWHAKTMAPKSR